MVEIANLLLNEFYANILLALTWVAISHMLKVCAASLSFSFSFPFLCYRYTWEQIMCLNKR